MKIPSKLLLSDLLRHRVICDLGIDHGPGVLVWMHPPVHRILGWVSRPSAINVSRHIWKLNQICGITSNQIFVKGNPSEAKPSILDTLPTIISSSLLDVDGNFLGKIVDATFNPFDGVIENYLVSRTDPRIPGTSRWSLMIGKIKGYQAGFVFSDFTSLDDLPLLHSSLRQKFIDKSAFLKEQILDIGERANNKLEGWIDDIPKPDDSFDNPTSEDLEQDSFLEDWNNSDNEVIPEKWPSGSEKLQYRSKRSKVIDNESDPWI